MKRILVLFVVLVVTLSALLYFKLREQRLEGNRASGGSGTLEGIEVDVVARISSRIRAIRVEEGATVKAGELLVELDCTEQHALLEQAAAALRGAAFAQEGARVGLATAQQLAATTQRQVAATQAGARATAAQAEAARVQQEAAARAAARVEQVLASGAASAQMIDNTQSQAEGLAQQVAALRASTQAALEQSAATASSARAAQLQVDAARVKLQATEVEIAAAQANHTRATALVAECTLRAPRDGYIQSRNFEEGEVVLPGSRILTLVDTREVKATFYLPNAELAAAQPGQVVEVVPDAQSAQRYTGRIRHVGVTAEFTPRNVQTREDRDRLVYAVEVGIPNPDGRLHPGMPVEIRIPGTERQ